MNTAVVTIIAKNYLAQARVLMDSVKTANPDFSRIVLLIDAVEGCFDPEQENFSLVTSEELEIPKSRWFHFKYSVLELSTAVKPFFLSWLLHKRGIEKIIYLDPDILVFAGLSTIEDALDASTNIVITPHLTAELDDDSHPGELQVLRSGTYNLGFIAVKASPETDKFLRWWQVHLYDHCIVDLARGLFVDQRWVDLVPGLFSGVRILRDDGYNVAYWNAKHRRVSWKNGAACANGGPLFFFHFSGYDPETPEIFSKHQDRISLHEREDLKQLCGQYREALFARGFAAASRWNYTQARFRNGHAIPDVGRHLLDEAPELLEIEDPFSDEGFARITQVWNSPVSRGGASVTKLAYRVYRLRDDVQAAMPDIFGADHTRFLEWMRSTDLSDHVLSEPSLRGSPQQVSRLTALARNIYETRPDLQRIFPDPEGRDAPAYLGWLLTYGKHSYKLPEENLAPVRRAFRELRSELRFSGRVRLDLYSIWLRAALVAGPLVTRMRNLRAPRPAGSKATAPADSAVSPGVNIHGYFRAETGLGQSARNGVQAMRAAGIPFTVHNLAASGHSEMDRSIHGYSDGAPYGIDLYFANADQTDSIHGDSTRSPERYRIGSWAWELDELPQAWDQAFRAYDEIWAPSGFCQAAIAARSPIPVIRIPRCVDAPVASAKTRADFAIDPGRFVFLTVFDMRSSFNRKNPLAVLRAFNQAFPNRSDCQLIVKINHANADPHKLQILRDEAAGRPIRLIEETWRHEDVAALIRACDCLISLHRSEGFGRVLGEAMLMEKPVIVTSYSGNLDFTTPHTAFLVGYTLQAVGDGNAPYPPKSLWANPNVEDAARQMKTVYEDETLRTERARAGRVLMETRFSAAAVGAAMKARLQVVAQLRVR